jgi:hypothetical protein
MAMKLHSLFATAALSGALAFGGVSVAVAHHGNFDDHTTTKAQTKAQAERMERRITAELNQKSLMLAQAAPQSPMTTPEGTIPAPQGAPSGGQAELMPPQPPELAAVEEDDDVN